MNLEQLYDKYKKLPVKRNFSGKEALKAVKKNGYALQYVKDQTEEVCLAAVEECENALQYVNESIFEEMISKLDKTLMLVSPSKHIRKLGKKI